MYIYIKKKKKDFAFTPSHLNNQQNHSNNSNPNKENHQEKKEKFKKKNKKKNPETGHLQPRPREPRRAT